MKYLQILMVAICFSELLCLGNDSDESDDDDEPSLVDDLPVLSVKTIYEYLTELMNSPKEDLNEMAKNTLQSLKSQMSDKSKQYAKLTLNGLRLAVNMGVAGSALRSKNESMIMQLWNLMVSLFYNILSWFGFGDQNINETCTIGAKKNINESSADSYNEEDVVFMISALQNQLCEIDWILQEKHAMIKYTRENSIAISEKVLDKIKEENFFEIEYKNKLEKSIELLQKEIDEANKTQETGNEEKPALQS